MSMASPLRKYSLYSSSHATPYMQPFTDADDCETEALEFCVKALGKKPDKVTRL